jgi:hypothetical protein
MTIPDFLRLLAQTRDDFHWNLTAHDADSDERRARSRINLNAIPEADSSLELGPLQAVCYVRTGKAFGAEEWGPAAEALGMDLTDAFAVAAAARDRTWTGPTGGRTPVLKLIGIQKQLLEAVGLAPMDNRPQTQVLLDFAPSNAAFRRP